MGTFLSNDPKLVYTLTASVAGTIREPETAYDGEASIELGIVHFPEHVVAETLKK